MARTLRAVFGIVGIVGCLLWIVPYKDVSVVFGESRQRAETKYIIVHHDCIDHETTIADIDEYHRNHNQWGSGFAYNFYLKDSKVYQVKPTDAPTANAQGHNYDAVSICVHGNFDKEEVTMTQQFELYLLIQYLRIRYPDAELKAHCDINETSCCGDNLIKLIRKWQK